MSSSSFPPTSIDDTIQRKGESDDESSNMNGQQQKRSVDTVEKDEKNDAKDKRSRVDRSSSSSDSRSNNNNYNNRSNDRNNNRSLSRDQSNLSSTSDVSTSDTEKKRMKKTKVAMLLSFVGSNYAGMQINPGQNTIEEQLRNAFASAEVISADNAEKLSKVGFQRTARTDKGVSAAAQVVSFKMGCYSGDVEKINSFLPSDIRVHGYLATTKGFNCKAHCSHRSYEYYVPTYAFAKAGKIDPNFRLDAGTLQKIRETLQLYVGTHRFHNFTSRVTMKSPQAFRVIKSFIAADPVTVAVPKELESKHEEFANVSEMEFILLRVVGQSFMLHQIRKMVAMCCVIAREQCDISKIQFAFDNPSIKIPRAPGICLSLENVFYDGYNLKAAKFSRPPLLFEEYKENVEKFKLEKIRPEVVKKEVQDAIILTWTRHLDEYVFGESHLPPGLERISNQGLGPSSGSPDSDSEEGEGASPVDDNDTSEVEEELD